MWKSGIQYLEPSFQSLTPLQTYFPTFTPVLSFSFPTSNSVLSDERKKCIGKWKGKESLDIIYLFQNVSPTTFDVFKKEPFYSLNLGPLKTHVGIIKLLEVGAMENFLSCRENALNLL